MTEIIDDTIVISFGTKDENEEIDGIRLNLVRRKFIPAMQAKGFEVSLHPAINTLSITGAKPEDKASIIHTLLTTIPYAKHDIAALARGDECPEHLFQ